MPFRCKCGRTFEKTDTFSSHTGSCAPFHQRRLSDTTQASASNPRRPSLPFLNTTSFSFLASQSSSPIDSISPMDKHSDLSSSVPNSFFMPTALSIQNAFEGARRRSMSYGSPLK